MDLFPLAGEVLSGKREEVPAEQRRPLFDLLVQGKVVLFHADRERPGAPSLPRFAALCPEELAGDLERERARCDSQRRAMLEAQAALAGADIPLLLFKSSGPYPYTSSNVDALVPEGELERAVNVLEGERHHEMTHYWEPNKRLLRQFRGRECTVMVHLHTRVSWIVLSFVSPADLWEHARTSPDGFRYPAPEDMVTCLLAHSVYESNRVSLGDVEKIHAALDATDFDWSRVREAATRFDWLSGLALARHWYAAGERALFGEARLDRAECRAELPPVPPEQVVAVERALAMTWPVALSKRVTKPYFFRKLAGDPAHGPVRKLGDAVGVGLQLSGRLGLRQRPATLVCLCGVDGSGKTTQAEALRAALSECELPNRRVWLRGGFSPVSEWLKSGLRGSLPALPDTGDQAGKARAYEGGRARWLWLSWVAVEQIVWAFWRVRVPLLLGRSVVAERYVPDTLVDLAERTHDPSFGERGLGRIMRWLTPRPHLILWLDLPGAVAHARKSDDWDPEILEERRALYGRVLAPYAHTHTLDADLPRAELERDVVDRGLTCALGRIRARNPWVRISRDAWT